MYVLYEHHKGPDGAILVTDMALTFRFPGNPRIDFRRLSVQQKALFEIVKDTFFKDIHPRYRSMDDKTKVWSFFAPYGKTLYENLKASPLTQVGLLFERVDGLQASFENEWVERSKIVIDPHDFFYTPAGQTNVSSGPSREQAIMQLAAILNLPTEALTSEVRDGDLIKRAYRRSALALHPDRNNGDGSKMSELNMLWQVYNV